MAEGWDNDDVRVRPGRGSRPRTKIRPTHGNAVEGFVTTVDRGRYTVLVGGEGPDRQVIAMRARELRRQAIVVGDRVGLVGDASGAAGTLARIVRVLDRVSILRRSADDTDTSERVVVANADTLLIVTATADPEPRTGFVDRCLVAAYTGHLQPMLLVTKSDLRDPTEFLAHYTDLDLPVLVSGHARSGVLDGAAIAQVRATLAGGVTAMIGHSGVGKSTLVNALVPQADRATGSVTGVGKGRHTSSSAVAFPLPDGGWIIDTPGVRSFGLAHVTADDVLESFDDLLPGTVDCPPNCTHQSADIGCALDEFVTATGIPSGRLDSFRRLLGSLAAD